MHDLYNAVWTNKTLNKFLPRLPRQAYLVGGCVRDLILGIDPSDYDIVFFGEPMILARQISDILGGKPFFIDENRQVARVAVDHGNLTIDVSPPRGENIEADLAERDITINAMACDPTDGALIDPTGGLEDLSERRIRLIAEKNLKDDPLRGLRCLRFSVQIGGSVDPGTMDLIRIHADSLHEAASERIKNEFFKALGHPVSSLFFKLLADAGYLSVLFRTDIGGERLGKAVALVSEVERCLNDVSKYLPGIKDHFGHELEHALTRTGALRLAAFFIEVIEAPLQKRDYDFFKRIALSSKTKQVIYKTISGCSDVINLGEVSTISGRDKHRLLKAHSLCVPEILMLAMASYTGKERKASGQQERDASFRAYIGSLWNYYLTTYRENEVNPLLTGDDIMDVFHMAPGPKVGVLLRQVDEARADGLITTRQDAFDYLRRIISE